MSDRALKWYFGSALVLVLLAGLFAYRPSIVLGVEGMVLSNSVNGSSFSYHKPCRRLSGDTWRCPVLVGENRTSTPARYPYRVEVSRWGCWEAQRTAAAFGNSPPTLSGCITLLDH
jgi:hypothetical protein